MTETTSRFPVLPRDPTVSVLAASRQSVLGQDRLEVVHAPAPRRSPARTGRHRRPVPRPSGRGLPPWTLTAAPLVVLTGGAALVSLGLALPGPLVAVGLVLLLGLVGSPLVTTTRIPLPDPLVRTALSVAAGLVLLSSLVALLDVLAPGLRPGALPSVLVVDGLVVVLHLLARRSAGPPRRLDLPAGPSPVRAWAPRLAVVVLPVLAWLDATGTAASPGWLRAGVLAATLVLLFHRHVTAERAGAHRWWTAAVLYAIAVAVLTPLASPGPSGSPAWAGVLVRVGGVDSDEVTRIVLPAVSGLVVVVAWLTAERVLGAARAVPVATLVLAVLLAAPSTWGDLPVTAAVLLVVAARGAHSAGSLLGRRLAVLALTVGAMIEAPSATVFAAQLCLAALLAVLVGRPARGVLTLPLALLVAAAVWVATLLRAGSDLNGAPWTTTTWVVAGAAGLGLLAVLARRVQPAVRDREFLLVAVAGLVLEVAVTAGNGLDGSGGVVTPVVVLLAVPAVLGVATAWGLLAGGLGAVLDRVPGTRLRTSARATRGHRLPPARLNRTAALALGLLALEYLRRASG